MLQAFPANRNTPLGTLDFMNVQSIYLDLLEDAEKGEARPASQLSQ